MPTNGARSRKRMLYALPLLAARNITHPNGFLRQLYHRVFYGEPRRLVPQESDQLVVKVSRPPGTESIRDVERHFWLLGIPRGLPSHEIERSVRGDREDCAGISPWQWMRVPIRVKCVKEKNVVRVGNQPFAVLRALKKSTANKHDAVCGVRLFRPFPFDVRPALEVDEGNPHGFVKKPPRVRKDAV